MFQPWVEVNDAEVYAVICSIEKDYIRLQNRTVKAMSHDIENITWHHIIFALFCMIMSRELHDAIQFHPMFYEAWNNATRNMQRYWCQQILFHLQSLFLNFLEFGHVFQAFDLFFNMFHCHVGVRHLKVITWDINHELYIYTYISDIYIYIHESYSLFSSTIDSCSNHPRKKQNLPTKTGRH